MGKAKKTQPFEDYAPKVGRRTIDDGWLSANRDALLGILCSWWSDIGWQLTTASTREELRKALQPVKDHPSRQCIDRLLRPTSVTANAGEIREKRLAVGEAVKRMHEAQAKCNKCVNACREIEVAVCQARPDQTEFVLREFSGRRAECQEAQGKLWVANAVEKTVEEELLDKEAAFAQDELLEFITKGKYARDPWNLANAMAGLPFAREVSFLGVWVSHARCSQIDSHRPSNFQYQLFEAIESFWNRSQSSSLSNIAFFRQEIETLPKSITPTIVNGIGPKRVANPLRQYFSDHFYDLQRAIETALETKDDPRPIHFIISSNFIKFAAQPTTAADRVVAQAARIDH